MAYLRNPRVRVTWGGENLSSHPDFDGASVVYDVEVDITKEGDGPTATMKWDPSGKGMQLYEKLAQGSADQQIIIEWFYSDGKKIKFTHVWAGQSINYGNDMSITVKMQSELSGAVNANIRSTATVFDEDEGGTAQEAMEKAKELHGADDKLKISQGSEKYLSKAKFNHIYGNDWTFGANIGQIAKQTGDQVFASNIGSKSQLVIMPPYSYTEDGNEEEVEDGSQASEPEPDKRYGYILGPAVISTITRSYNWKPPQQDSSQTPAKQPFATDPEKAEESSNPPSKPQKSEKESAKETSAPLGTANGRASLAINNHENEKGPDRQLALNKEQESQLTFETMMVPLLVGLKPHDIIFIPSLSGDHMEDWIVKTVGYRASRGNVTLSVTATRVFAQVAPMNEKAAEKFKGIAEGKGLIGGNASLENWDKYAWGG